MKICIGVTVAMGLISCSSGNQNNNLDHLSSSAATGYDPSAYALAEVLTEIEDDIDTEVVAEMSEEDIADEIETRKEAMIEKFDLNDDGVVDTSERRKMKKSLARIRIKKFDKDGDGKIDASEKSEIRNRVVKKIKMSKESHKGKKRNKVTMCKKVQDFVSDGKHAVIAKKPLIERVIARCEGIEIKGKLPYELRRANRCRGLLQLSLAEKTSPSPGLKNLLESCQKIEAKPNMVQRFGPEALAVIEILDMINEEDSAISAEITEEDVAMAIEDLKEKYLERFDTNKDGKIGDKERKSMISTHRAKRIASFDKDKNGTIDETEKKMVNQLIRRNLKFNSTKKNGALHFATLCRKLEVRASNMNSEASADNPLLDTLMAKCEGIDLSDTKANRGEKKIKRCERTIKKRSERAKKQGREKMGERLKWLAKKCKLETLPSDDKPDEDMESDAK